MKKENKNPLSLDLENFPRSKRLLIDDPSLKNISNTLFDRAAKAFFAHSFPLSNFRHEKLPHFFRRLPLLKKGTNKIRVFEYYWNKMKDQYHK
jgi:hypothetical protein